MDVLGSTDFVQLVLAKNPKWFIKKPTRPVGNPLNDKTTCTATKTIGKIYPKTSKK